MENQYLLNIASEVSGFEFPPREATTFLKDIYFKTRMSLFVVF